MGRTRRDRPGRRRMRHHGRRRQQGTQASHIGPACALWSADCANTVPGWHRSRRFGMRRSPGGQRDPAATWNRWSEGGGIDFSLLPQDKNKNKLSRPVRSRMSWAGLPISDDRDGEGGGRALPDHARQGRRIRPSEADEVRGGRLPRLRCGVVRDGARSSSTDKEGNATEKRPSSLIRTSATRRPALEG